MSPKTSIAPILSVRRGMQAVEFYKAAFSADVLFRLDGEDGGVVAQLSVDGAEFWVADESPAHFNFSPETLGGATVVSPMVDQRYGWRVGRVADPFGHHWEIGKPLS